MTSHKTKTSNYFAENKHRFTTVPLAVMPHLTPLQAILYGRMRDDFEFFTKERGMYQPSNAILSENLNSNDKTLRRAIDVLVKKGYAVRVSTRKGCCTVYHMNDITEDGLPLETPIRMTKRLKTILEMQERIENEASVQDDFPTQEKGTPDKMTEVVRSKCPRYSGQNVLHTKLLLHSPYTLKEKDTLKENSKVNEVVRNTPSRDAIQDTSHECDTPPSSDSSNSDLPNSIVFTSPDFNPFAEPLEEVSNAERANRRPVLLNTVDILAEMDSPDFERPF